MRRTGKKIIWIVKLIRKKSGWAILSWLLRTIKWAQVSTRVPVERKINKRTSSFFHLILPMHAAFHLTRACLCNRVLTVRWPTATKIQRPPNRLRHFVRSGIKAWRREAQLRLALWNIEANWEHFLAAYVGYLQQGKSAEASLIGDFHWPVLALVLQKCSERIPRLAALLWRLSFIVWQHSA